MQIGISLMSRQRDRNGLRARTVMVVTHDTVTQGTPSYQVNADSPTEDPLHGQEHTLGNPGRKPLLTLVQKPAATMPQKGSWCSWKQFLMLMARLSKPAAQASVRRTLQQRPGPEDRTQCNAHDERTKLLGQARTGYRIGHVSTRRSICAT